MKSHQQQSQLSFGFVSGRELCTIRHTLFSGIPICVVGGARDTTCNPRVYKPPTRRFGINMTVADLKSENSNAKLWAVLSLDSASLVSAKFVSSDGGKVQSIWTQRDVIASRKRYFSSTYVHSNSDTYSSPAPVEINNSSGLDYFHSPSGKKHLKFTTEPRNKQEGSVPGSIFAEVWTTGGGLDRVWEIDSSIHGPIFSDEWFGSGKWSPDETMFVYTADRPRATPQDETRDKDESWLEPLQYRFHENARDPFGEAYIGKRSPTLFVADVVEGVSYPLLQENPSDLKRKILGDPNWSPDGKLIVATMRRATDAVDADEGEEGVFLPPDLGLRYCYNRMSSIVLIEAPRSRHELTSGPRSMRIVSNAKDADDYCCNSPRFSPSGQDIIYLSAPRYEDPSFQGKVLPHNTTKVLRAVQLRNNKLSLPRTVISVPENPSPKEFPGLYLHSLLANPWLGSDAILLTTTWGSVNKVMLAVVPRENGELWHEVGDLKLVDWGSALSLVDLKDHSINEDDNVSVLDICESAVLLAVSNPVMPTALFVARNSLSSPMTVMAVSQLSPRARALKRLLDVTHTVDLILQPGKESGIAKEYDATIDERSMRFQVTLILPKTDGTKRPFIVYPHGGPHVATLNGYSQGTAALLKRGFAVMYVNYRGSLGLGQKSLETLPGNVGTQEVSEVAQATRWALSNPGYGLDPERVGFVGGSHSGFIGAHTSLIPGLFKRTVLRNPVVNIATMVGASDIPDWCFCEANVGSQNVNGWRYAADSEQMRVMYEVSPISRVKPIADPKQRPGPTLLQVGGSDRRVPPQQSLEWKRIMTQAYGEGNVTVRWYPDSGHAIDEVPNGDDAWVHALDFLCKL
ncbi:unnamed protein product [Chondrus crispus]|uniref:Acylamino-acid-releasing enzyme n=1 Tax=Chondrus crispus TaxID=2769 RepID=R7QJ36_CHOCR|nr:unnamed protein product [Chondrus crispus]CDF38507.1 unnamed protein product [Chondrus crispus]|eukprot:XP_005718400.1 unnamed protein product [Chondrus crispus]